MNDVVRLVHRAPVPVGDDSEFKSWASDWLDALVSGEYGHLRSLVMVVENTDGEVAIVSQSLGSIDGARLAGLLLYAAHRRMDGHADIESMRRKVP